MRRSTPSPLTVLAFSLVAAAVLLGVLSLVGHGPAETDADPAVVEALGDGGEVLLIRHALTDQSVSDADPTARGGCEQQRPLSEEGRAQAERLGRRLAALEVPVGAVHASPFCRTAETAQLIAEGAGIGGESVQVTEALLSLTAERDDAGVRARVDEGAALITEELGGDDVAVMVTHTQNIEALTGRLVEEGDAVVLTEVDGTITVVDVVPAADW